MRVRYAASRSPFLKYLGWNKPCLRFDKAPETDFCFFRHSLTSLGASRLVNASSPRNICIDKKKISSGTQGKTKWAPIMNITFRPGKGIRIPESEECLLLESGIREFYLMESGILGFGIHNTAQGNRNRANHWNPESKFHWQGSWNAESRIRDSLGFLYMRLITISCF